MKWSILLFPFIFLLQTGSSRLSVEHSGFIVLSPQQTLIYTPDQQLKTIDPQGKEVYTYTEQLMADITDVSLTTSMRPMVFYGDVPAFQIVDNTLSPHSAAVNLLDFELENVTLMKPTENNGYWTWDPVSQVLQRHNENLQEQASSGDLRAVLDGPLEAIDLEIGNNRAYLLDPATGIHLFDFYAGYLGLIDNTSGIRDFDVGEGRLVSVGPNGLHVRDKQSKKDDLYRLTADRMIPIEMDDPMTVVATADRVHVGDQRSIITLTVPR